VKKTFGEQFASGFSALPIGQWRGPVSSSYGSHFIFLSQRSAGYLPALADVRDQVRREWLDAKRIEATDRFYETLLRRYTVKIEPLEEKKVAQVH
jgi:parvulin-like peptidyl-prolyl isomerase